MNVKITGDKKVVALLKKIPRGMKIEVMRGVAEYTIGDERHGLKWYPAPAGQKYVRTYKLRGGWEVKESNSDWTRVQIMNDVPYAPYVPPRWSHYGWREYVSIVQSNVKGALRAGQARFNAWLKRQT